MKSSSLALVAGLALLAKVATADYYSITSYTSTTACTGTISETYVSNMGTAPTCTQYPGSSTMWMLQSCKDSTTQQIVYYTDNTCKTVSTAFPATNEALTCYSGSYGSSLRKCVTGTFPASNPSATGNKLLVSLYSSSATCTGSPIEYHASDVVFGVCTTLSSGGSMMPYCKNGVPSPTEYTDSKCSVGGTPKTMGCMANGQGGSMQYSCVTSASSGAAAVATGVVAAVAAAAAVVSLA